MVSANNCLAFHYPHLINQVHPTKNNNLTAFNIIAGSKKKYWWICEKGHEWEANCNNRTKNKAKCPYCTNRKVCKDNCLATISPNISKQWHPTKNDDLTPFDVLAGTHQKFWWMCKKNHEWEAECSTRLSGKNCPICRLSQGELKVKKYLDSQKISYKPQFKFESCKLQRLLPFDFLVEKDNKLFLIEYQGIQHFIPKSFGSKKIKSKISNFKLVTITDYVKENWAYKNKIPFLAIPYWEENNIEIILENFFLGKEINFSKFPNVVEKYNKLKEKILNEANKKTALCKNNAV